MFGRILLVAILAVGLIGGCAVTNGDSTANSGQHKYPTEQELKAAIKGSGKIPVLKSDIKRKEVYTNVKLAGIPYLGLALRPDDKTGAVLVSAVQPGPLDGNGTHSPYIYRGDTMLAINDQPVTMENFVKIVRSFKPGDKIKLTYKRTGKLEITAVPEAAVEGPIMEVEVILDSMAAYENPLQFERPENMPLGKDRLSEPDALEKFIVQSLKDNKLDEPITNLFKVFTDNEAKSYNMLSRVMAAFERPTALPAIERQITNPLTKLPEDPRKVLVEAADNLDITVKLALKDKMDLSQPGVALLNVSKAYSLAEQKLQAAFADCDDPNLLAKQAEDLLGVFKDREVSLETLLHTMRQSKKIKYPELFQAAAELSGLMIKSDLPDPKAPAVKLPSELKGAVEGDILAAVKNNGRWFIYGAACNNVYDMSKIDVVIDAGGDNLYNYPARRELEKRPFLQIVVDMAGNTEHNSQILAPGAGIAGISMIVDYAGNDEYYTKGLGGDGIGCFGIGLVLDFGGNDIHRGEFYSQGVGYYGAGMVISLGGGSSIYEAHRLSQGVGLPRGFGLLFDANGNDMYRANGPVPSVYDVPAVYSSQSQGFGYGFRGYDVGGIGALMDLNGNDRYESGEFAQGCGYFYSIGLLNDRNGDDIYYGARYTQGASAHQAFGILADDLGDDTYWGNVAANQGAGWDIAMGLLLDRGGNNTYYGGGISQGSGAMQGIGWLLNLGGRSHFVGPLNSQGRSAGNEYHYADTKCFSFSLLLNTSGQEDFYNQEDRQNGVTKTVGEPDEKIPANSNLHGLFIDTPNRVELK